MANHTVILYCPKTVVLWDQIRFSPLEAPIANFGTPFSRFISFSLFWSFVNDSSKFFKMFLYRSSFSAFILIFSFETSDELTVYIGSWLMIKFVSCLLITLEFSYSNFAVSRKTGIFNSPYRVGNDNSTLSLSEHIWPPVIGAMSFCRIVCSNGSSNSLLSGIVQIPICQFTFKAADRPCICWLWLGLSYFWQEL